MKYLGCNRYDYEFISWVSRLELCALKLRMCTSFVSVLSYYIIQIACAQAKNVDANPAKKARTDTKLKTAFVRGLELADVADPSEGKPELPPL